MPGGGRGREMQFQLMEKPGQDRKGQQRIGLFLIDFEQVGQQVLQTVKAGCFLGIGIGGYTVKGKLWQSGIAGEIAAVDLEGCEWNCY